MKLYIRTTKTVGEATLYANVNMGTARKWMPLGMKVNIADWLKTYTGMDGNNKPVQSSKRVEGAFVQTWLLAKSSRHRGGMARPAEERQVHGGGLG